MKAIIKFNLPEEQAEYDMFNQARDMNKCLWEIGEYCRSQLKYNDELDEKTSMMLERIRSLINVEIF